MPWYSYTGTNPANPSHYTFQSTEPSCGTNQEQLCAIQATDNGSGKPDLDVSILSEMVQALNEPGNTTNVRLKPR